MPTIGALSPLVTEPSFGAEPKDATVPLASASQYPAPLASGAMPMTALDDTSDETCPHDRVTSVGGAQEPTMMAASEPPADPFGAYAPPIDSTAGPFGHAGNDASMTSRWSQ